MWQMPQTKESPLKNITIKEQGSATGNLADRRQETLDEVKQQYKYNWIAWQMYDKKWDQFN